MLANSLEDYFVQLVQYFCASLFPWSHCAVELAAAVVSHKLDKLDSFHTLFLFLVKMRTNQSYLFVFLLASLSTSCTSDCPTLDPYSEPPYHKCAKLYNLLETALLANPKNLYKLQDFFFPSSSSEPIYARVTFALNKHFYSTCWTSSVLLKSLDPRVLSYLQIQFLNILFELEDPSNPSTGLMYNNYVFFNLTVNSTVSDYSPYTINAVLQELTTWVSIFECWIN